MDDQYDINVDYEALCETEDKLKRIGNNLNESTERMVLALQYCQGFLSGNQFDKASQTTFDCIEQAGKTSNNISNAINYIEQLKHAVERYSKCVY